MSEIIGQKLQSDEEIMAEYEGRQNLKKEEIAIFGSIIKMHSMDYSGTILSLSPASKSLLPIPLWEM